METCLIIPAPIRSHIIPSLFLAELLSNHYTINYATHNGDLMELVACNAYNNFPLDEERFGLGFDPLSAYNKHKQKVSLHFLADAVKNSVRMDVYRRRKEALVKIVTQIQPSLILIDIFSSTDLLVLKPLYPNTNYVFFSPMLNTYNHPEKQIPGSLNRKTKTTVFQRIKRFTSPYNFLSKLTGYNPSWQLKRLYNKYPSLKKHLPDSDNQKVRMFKNVPELILAPLELEYHAEIQRSHQLYLGLSQAESRVDSNIDQEFNLRFSKILQKIKETNKKLVYCSFGSYFSSLEEYKHIAAFCVLLVKAFQDNSVEFIVSVNQAITDKIKEIIDLPENFSFFYRVQQTKVLEFTDVFVTHGGLGSIKEAIQFAVPMLVYPLDKTWDQPDNASKIEFHELGLKGSFRTDGAAEIRFNILKLLEEKKFKEKMLIFQQKCKTRYFKESLVEEINHLLIQYKER